MAFSTTSVDTYRGTSGVSLPKQLSNEILQGAVESSVVMSMARKIELPGSGITIPVITSDPEAAWVDETNEKAVGEPGISSKNMTPYKLAIIELFSNEFKRDLNSLYNALVERLPYAIAKKFDATVFFGSTPGTGFDVLASAPTVKFDCAHDGEYAALVAADASVSALGGILNGWAVSPQGKSILLGATDSTGRPLFLSSTEQGNVARILGADVKICKAAYKAGTSGAPNKVAVAGDWSKARWGAVQDVQIKISEEATINDGTNQINLWQRNMFAVMCEVELGFVCADDDYFVIITDEDEADASAGGE